MSIENSRGFWSRQTNPVDCSAPAVASQIDEDEIDPAVAAWEQKAQKERLRCRVCAMTIPYGSREQYSRTRCCGYCAHQAELKVGAPELRAGEVRRFEQTESCPA